MPQNCISFFKPCIYGTENIWAVQMKGNIILENHNVEMLKMIILSSAPISYNLHLNVGLLQLN